VNEQHAPAGKKNCPMAFLQKKNTLSNGETKNCFATKICFMYLYALQINTSTCIYLLLCQEDVEL
jgi:hypothetical protein